MSVTPSSRVLRIAVVLIIIPAMTLGGLRPLTANATTAAELFLLAILIIAARWSLLEAVIASVTAVLCFNYYFLPPVGTFTIADPENWVALFAFLVTSIIASQLSARARQRAEEALDREHEMERLYELSRALLLSGTGQSVGADAARDINRIFECGAVAFYDRESDLVFRAGARDLPAPDVRLRDAALQGTVLRDAEAGLVIMPVSLGGRSAGSLCVPQGVISDAALNALTNLAAIALEREKARIITAGAEAARRNEELKSTLLDAVAHEFKTPLTSIKAAATALLSASIPGSADRELLTVIDEEAERLNEMVSEAIQMARIEAGRVQLHKEALNMAELVDEVLRSSAAFLEERPVTVDLARDLPPALVDRELITLVLRQLLHNAAKYSAPGSAIAVHGSLQSGSILLAIHDRGRGIAESEQTKIFDKFYRALEVRGSIPGTGMGLAIAREIVQAHRGRMWVESQAGQGSRFSFSLPAAVTGASAP